MGEREREWRRRVRRGSFERETMNVPGGGGATREVVCSGCNTLLRYPAGAHVVRCVLCSNVTQVVQQPQQPQPQQQISHLICGGCRTMLAYPTGATSVRCAVCTTVNQTGVAPQTMANIRCQGCNTHLMYSSGATSVRCALCDFVTQVGGAATIPQQPQLQQRVQQQQQGSSSSLGPGAQGGSSMPAQQNSDFLQRQNSNSLYVIQNPSVEGEEVFSMAIGVKQDSKPVP